MTYRQTEEKSKTSLDGVFPSDMPFGLAAELRRIALEQAAEKETTIVSQIRDEIRRWKEQERERREQ